MIDEALSGVDDEVTENEEAVNETEIDDHVFSVDPVPVTSDVRPDGMLIFRTTD